jgi:hypothetical protein
MKTKRHLHFWVIIGLVLLGSLMAVPQTAKADDTLNKLAQLMDTVHQFAPDMPSGSDVLGMIDLFSCLANAGNDVEVVQCLNDWASKNQSTNSYIDTLYKIAEMYVAIRNQDMWGVVGIAVEWLYEDAPCIVADIVFPGVGGSICELVKELIEFAVQVAESIVQFFEDIGEALYDVAKAVYCFFFGCDDDSPPPPPPEQVVYNSYYAPKLDQGLAARKQYHWPYYAGDIGDIAFQQFFQNLNNGAYNAVSSALLQAGITPSHQEVWNIVYTDGEQYRQQLNANWSAEIVQQDGPALSQRRNDYIRPQNLSNTLAEIENKINQWVANSSRPVPHPIYPPTTSPLNQTFTSMCLDHFKDFAHVDYWISTYPDKAAPLQMVTNQTWCGSVEQKFDAQLADYIKKATPKNCSWDGQLYHCDQATDYTGCYVLKGIIGQQNLCDLKVPQSCAWDGQHYQCASLQDYRTCTQLEASINLPDRCGVNLANAAVEEAKEIDDYFKSKGSLIPCKYPKKSTGMYPVDFVCTRPTQVEACKNYNFGSIPKVVNCVGPVETSEYVALQSRVNHVVANLAKGDPMCSITPDQHCEVAKASDKTKTATGVVIPGATQTQDQGKKAGTATKPKNVTAIGTIFDGTCDNSIGSSTDPLLVMASPCVVSKVRNNADQNFGFGPPSSKPGFEYDNTHVNPIDGASTPVLLALSSNKKGKSTAGTSPGKQPLTTVKTGAQLQGELENGTIELGVEKKVLDIQSNPDNPADTGVGTGNQGGTPDLTLNKGTIIVGPSQGGTGDTGTGKVSPVMSGNVTITEGANIQGQTQTQNTNATETTNAGTPMSLTIAPDLTCIVGPKIAGQSAAWGGTITVEGKEAVSRNNGICEFQFEYTVRNVGNGPLGGTSGNKTFRTILTNSAVGGNWTHVFTLMAPKSAQSDTVRIPLKPGNNVLQLVLDDQHQIKESNENNNTFKVTVIVKGKCEKLK